MLYKFESFFEWFMQTWLTADINDYLSLAAAVVFIAWSVKVYGAK